MEQIVTYFLMVQKFTNLKQKIRNFCRSNMSWKHFRKETGFNSYVYDFSVDYSATDVDDIKDIYLIFDEKE